ncbi:HAD-IA family hydrolase [Candidatus Nomurabacteria bacterium]|nr:HAD-IA family hydrolase [Candidatus Nomurabacteria bacterium]
MIKVVIFDADEVLVHGKRRFSVTLAEKHDISLETTLPFFIGPFQECLIGDKDLKETVAPYLEKWGWDKGVDALLDYWFKLESEIDAELVQYIKELRGKGILCFLATNNEKYRFQYMMDKMGLVNVFDKTYASAHLGHKKPDQKFFSKIFQELVNVQKSEILFVDDSRENIQGAEDFGIHAEHYTNIANLKNKISLLNSK